MINGTFGRTPLGKISAGGLNWTVTTWNPGSEFFLTPEGWVISRRMYVDAIFTNHHVYRVRSS